MRVRGREKPYLRKTKWKRPTNGQRAEEEAVGALRTRWDIFIKAFTSRLRDLYAWESTETPEVRDSTHPEQTMSSSHPVIDGHMNLWRLCRHLQGLCRFKLLRVLSLRGGNELLWLGSYSNQETIYSQYLLAKEKNQFPLVESHWVYQPHFRAGPMARSCWPKENKLSDNFCRLFFFCSEFALLQ